MSKRQDCRSRTQCDAGSNSSRGARRVGATGVVAAMSLIFGSVIVGLLLVEIASDLLFRSSGGPSAYDWAHRIMFFDGAEGIFQNHGKLFTYLPNERVRSLTTYYSDNDFVVEYDYQFRTNNYGLVQDVDVDPDRPSLLLLGDSFTEGQGAAPWFAKLLMRSENDRYQIINGGLLGTGFGQWNLLQDYLSADKRVNIQKLLVIFISDDYSRGVWNVRPTGFECLRSILECDLGESTLFKLPLLSELPDWVSKIRTARNSRNGFMKKIDQITSRILPSTYHALQYLKTKASFKTRQRMELSRVGINALIQKYKSENVVFLHLPQKDEVFGPSDLGKEARATIQEAGGTLLDGFQLCPLSPNEYHIHDGHPNEKGYSRIADCVTKIIHQMADGDLTGLFWTKLCEKLSLERSFGDAEEEV
jgi:hypothetical protein